MYSFIYPFIYLNIYLFIDLFIAYFMYAFVYEFSYVCACEESTSQHRASLGISKQKKGMVRYLDKSEGEHLLRLVVLTVLTFKINLAHRTVTVVNSWAPGHYHPT